MLFLANAKDKGSLCVLAGWLCACVSVCRFLYASYELDTRPSNNIGTLPSPSEIL